MVIHYIHGLDSFPRPERLQIIEKLGHRPVALHLDYMKQPDAFQILCDFAKQEKAEFVVGSSLGGFLGNWVANALGLPCLLFNPAMRVKLSEANIPLDTPQNCPQRHVWLGAYDPVVDPHLSWRYFGLPENQAPYQRIAMQQGLGHLIDEPTFEEVLKWAGI